MSCNCCVGEPDPNFITADLNSKIGEIYAALIASGAVDLVITSVTLTDTTPLVLPEGTYRYVRVENYSDPGVGNNVAVVNGADLPAGARPIEYNVPYGHLNVPSLTIVGNVDGVRVDYFAW